MRASLPQTCLVAMVVVVALSARGQDTAAPRPLDLPLARTWNAREYGGGPINLAVVQEPKTGFVYVGNGRGVLEYDGARWQMIPLPDHGPARAMAIDAQGTIWICSYNEIAVLKPDAVGELQTVSMLNQLPEAQRGIEFLNQALNTPDGMTFTERNHVLVFPPKGKVRVWRSEQQLQRVWWMDGALHVTVSGRGVFRFKFGEELVASPVTATVPRALDLTQLKVFTARPGEEGRTWLLTSRGPVEWDHRTSTVRMAAPAAISKSDEAGAATFLADGRTVFATEKGDCVVFDAHGELIRRFAALPSLTSGRPAEMLGDREGGVWVAKTAGLARLQFGEAPVAGLPAPAAMVRRAISSPNRVLFSGHAPPHVEALTLTPEHSTLRFEFAAPTYRIDLRGRTGAEFRTRLEGLDRDWTPWSPEARREFTDLPLRAYKFHVQARDVSGRIGPEALLAFSFEQYWWLTPWAFVAYALIGLVLIGSGHRLGTIMQRRRAAELEAVVAARTEELRRSNAELARLRQLDLDEKIAARLAEEKARLEVLRYQLNPHFLYNALNSVYSLVLTTPPAAASMVLRLADFCRVALDRKNGETTTVGAEFDKLTTYLDIEKVRWGDSLHVAIEASDEVRRATIPPFLLLPLVENAIKYGGATSRDDLRVRVAANLEPDHSLTLVVANSGEWVGPNTPTLVKSSGIGLANLRQRLQRHFPNAHSLSIEHDDGWVTVKVKIAHQPAPAESVAASVSK